MTALAVLLLAAAIAYALSRLSRLPAIPLLMLGGFGLKALAEAAEYSVPEDLLQNMVELGLAFLVFSAGIDLSPARVRSRGSAVFKVGIAQFTLLGFAGIVTGLLLSYPLATALFFGCALSASSTLVAIRHLQSRQKLFEPFGRLVTGVLLLQDVLIVLLLVILVSLPVGWVGTLGSVGAFAVLTAASLGFHRWISPWVAQRMHLDDEERLLFALAVLFLFIVLALLLGLPFVVGGFLAGFALSAFPMNGLVRSLVGSLSGFFLALFFMGIGFICVIPSPALWLHALVFGVVLVVSTVLLVTYVGERCGYTARAAIDSGLMLSQTSEFSLLILMAAMTAGQIDVEIFSMFALLTVTTMGMTSYIARDSVVAFLMHLHPKNRQQLAGNSELASVPSGHAVIVGYGDTGDRFLKLFQKLEIPTLVIEEDSAIIHRLRDEGVACVEGDCSDEEVLEMSRIGEARVVLAMTGTVRDAEQLIAAAVARDVPVLVRTADPVEYAFVEEMGGIPVDTLESTAEALALWVEINLSDKAETD